MLLAVLCSDNTMTHVLEAAQTHAAVHVICLWLNCNNMKYGCKSLHAGRAWQMVVSAYALSFCVCLEQILSLRTFAGMRALLS